MSVVGSILQFGIYIYPIYWICSNNLVPRIALGFSGINYSNGVPLENYKSKHGH